MLVGDRGPVFRCQNRVSRLRNPPKPTRDGPKTQPHRGTGRGGPQNRPRILPGSPGRLGTRKKTGRGPGASWNEPGLVGTSPQCPPPPSEAPQTDLPKCQRVPKNSKTCRGVPRAALPWVFLGPFSQDQECSARTRPASNEATNRVVLLSPPPSLVSAVPARGVTQKVHEPRPPKDGV